MYAGGCKSIWCHCVFISHTNHEGAQDRRTNRLKLVSLRGRINLKKNAKRLYDSRKVQWSTIYISYLNRRYDSMRWSNTEIKSSTNKLVLPRHPLNFWGVEKSRKKTRIIQRNDRSLLRGKYTRGKNSEINIMWSVMLKITTVPWRRNKRWVEFHSLILKSSSKYSLLLHGSVNFH